MSVGKKTKWVAGIVAALIIVGMAVYPKVVAEKPDDLAQVTEIKFQNLMGSRYTEILPVWGNALTKNFTAGIYNTIGLNGSNPAGGGDSTPAAIVDKIDIKRVAGEHAALSALMNGPRLWTVDHIGVKAGKERDFQGLKARLVGWFLVPAEFLAAGDRSYKVMHVERDTSMGINKGSRAYILDDPEGNTWVMKSAGLIVDPRQKFEDLKDLGSRLKPPGGWKFRSPVLEQDLEFMTDNGKTMITQDELGNTYDRVGGPFSNYKP